jgi:hypothetical protein
MSDTSIEQRRELNKPSTPQALHNAHSLILGQTPLDVRTFDEAEFNRLGKERREALAAAEAAQHPPEDSWRLELDELDRRLTGQLTPDEAELYANNEANKYKDAINAVDAEIKNLQGILKTPGLSRCQPLRDGREVAGNCRCDVCLFTRKVTALTLSLAPIKAKQQQSIRSCSGIILAAKELQPLRKRWQELKKREQKIAVARRAVQGKQNQTPLQQESFTNSDGFRAQHHSTRGGFRIAPGGMELDK